VRWPSFLTRKVEFKPLRIEGDPEEVFGLEHWKTLAEAHKTIPALAWVQRAAFEDAVADLRACLKGDKSHLELVRLAQKLSDLWEGLTMPRTAVAEANKILSTMQTEPTPPDRAGPRNVYGAP
jgi:hypothetical protein